MGSVRRFAAIMCAALAVGAFGAPDALAAKPTVITVGNGFQQYEYLPTCSNTAPFPCGQTALELGFRIYTSRMYSFPITVGWEIFGGTATPGVDFTGPTSGTVTIAANTINKEVLIPLVNDGFGEANETIRVRVTSASVPADLTSTGTETILDGSRIPADCSLSKTSAHQQSMTCTNRPPTQTWYQYTFCFYPWGDPAIRGNDVTGNGTSAGDCEPGWTQLYGTTFQVMP